MEQLPQKAVVFLSMVTQTTIKSLIVSVLLIPLVLIVGRVYSESLEVSGNASGSNNSININQTESNTVNQSNSIDVNNSVNTNSNTGDNSVDNGVDGGSIKTGNATSNVKINNQFNNNVSEINCKNCPSPTPTPKPSPSPTSQSAAAPSGNVGGGGGGDGGHDGEKGAAKSPEVLGLAATSSDNSFLQIIPGFLSIQTQPNDYAREPIVVDRAFKKVSRESDIKNIIIPRLNIDLPVVPSKIKNGYWEVSQTLASHGEGSANPGEDGNVVVFAHAREGLFLELRRIKKDDTVYVLTKDRWYKYKVSEIVFVYPNDTTTVGPTDSEILTLFTCSGFFDDKRLIVKATPESTYMPQL